ncbi:MAG: hypothetical protein HY879_16885 [Deltaproteobacteria bacterium]|nr:hypothetical protein [Deltaproteobacteria bacterium]
MELIRVNLTLSQEVIICRKDTQALTSAFEEASKDKKRQKIQIKWAKIDAEGWN